MAKAEDLDVSPGKSREIDSTKSDEAVGVAVTGVLTTQISGPIPSPNTLREYDEVLPGCAERIISAWEEENRHRRELDRRILEQDDFRSEQHYKLQLRGQIFASTLGMLLFSGSMLLVYLGHSAGGIAVLIGHSALRDDEDIS